MQQANSSEELTIVMKWKKGQVVHLPQQGTNQTESYGTNCTSRGSPTTLSQYIHSLAAT